MQVQLVTRHDGGLFAGGAEVQVAGTLQHLQERGVSAEIFTSVTSQLGDILHFFGPYSYFWDLAQYARERNVPFVASSIWFNPDSITALRIKRIRRSLFNRQTIRPVANLFRNAA